MPVKTSHDHEDFRNRINQRPFTGYVFRTRFDPDDMTRKGFWFFFIAVFLIVSHLGAFYLGYLSSQ